MLYNFCMIMCLLAYIKQKKFEDQYHLLYAVYGCLLIKFEGQTTEKLSICNPLTAHNTTSKMTKQKSFLFCFEVAFDCQLCQPGGQL